MNDVIVRSTAQLTLRLNVLIPQLESVATEFKEDPIQNFLNGIIARLLEAYQVISTWNWDALMSHFNGNVLVFLDTVAKVYETLISFLTEQNWNSIADPAWDSIINLVEGIFAIVLTIQDSV